MTEQALAQAWLERRDPDAFRGLCEKHSGMVYATALRVLRNPADAEDVTQESFLRLARASTTIRGSLGAWLHRVAVNLAIDHMRHNTSRSAREETFAELTPATTETTWNDLREHVDAAINELPDTIRDTVIAHFIEGVPQQALAEADGVTRSAVSQRINRALQMVRTTLEKRGVTVSLAALTSMFAANLSEAVAVPAGLAASLGNLAVYAGASNAGAGVVAGLLSAKGFAAIIAALLAVGGIGFAVLRGQDARPIAESVTVQGDVLAPDVALPLAASSAEPERGERSSTRSASPEPTAATPPTATGATVEGFVREQDTGGPLKGVLLIYQPDDGTGAFRYSGDEGVYTDEEGRYRITGLPPGRYKLLCSSMWATQDAGDAQKYEVELRFVKNESVRRFEITDDSTQSIPDFKAIVGETISGIVIDTAGNPVGDAHVSFHGGAVFPGAATWADGSFKAGGFPVTSEILLMAKKGRTNSGIIVRAIGETESIAAETDTLTSSIVGPLTVTENGLKEVRLVLQPGASVSGSFTDHLGQPLAEVNLMARSAVTGDFGSSFAKTDDEGDFVLSGLAKGEYDLAWNPRKPGEDEHTYGWTPYEALVLKHVEVTWDQHIEGIQLRADDLAVGPSKGGWTLAGRIRDARGSLVENASVRAWEIGKSGDSPTTKSESDGSFQVTGLSVNGLTMIRVEHPGYSTYMDSLPEPVENTVDIVLEDRGIVSGQVRFADTGMPVTSFYIRMRSGNRDPVLVNNEEGRFRVEGADAGDNAVLVSAEGFRETSTPVTVLPGREVAGVDARLERGLVVEGVVVNEHGAPVEGAFLFSKRVPTAAADRETQNLAKTDANGKFRIENVDNDEGSVAAWHPESGMGAAFYDVAASDIEIVLRNNLGAVTGKVLVDGLAAVGAEVSLMGTELLSAEAAAFGAPNRRVNEDGAFRFDDVPEGAYSLSVTIGERNVIKPMGRNLTRAIAVESGKETEGVLDLPPEDASVEGRVLRDGQPVSQGFVILTLESPEGKQTHTAQVGEGGSYLIGPVAAGRATLRTSVVTEAPFASMSQKLEFEIAPGETVLRDIEFNAHGTVQGTATGLPADQQLPVALIPGSIDVGEVTLETVLSLSQESVANTVLRGPGPFEFSAVPPGDYTVFAWLSNSSGRVEVYGTAYATIREDEAPASVRLQLRAP